MNIDVLKDLSPAEPASAGDLPPFGLFAAGVYPFLEFRWFHEAYYRVLEAFAAGRVRRLIVTMPPQHGKSVGASTLLPAYLLGRNPDLRIAIASYSASLASKFNRRVQRIIDSPEYAAFFPETTIKRGARPPEYLRTADEVEIIGHRGGLLSVGREGALTGNRVDCFILDDLYRLDDLAQIKSGYSGTQVSYQTPYKVSRIETISKHCIDIQRIGYVECIPESYRLNVGNILFSNINSIQYIGNTAYLDKDYGLYHGMNLLRIIPNTTIVRPRFLHLLLCTDWAINHFQTICNKAVSQASINQTALGKSRFPIPPMSVQQQICSMFELTERKLDNEQEYISCLQQQKRYLLQKMFI